jgi:hypothetical protein
MTTTEGRGALGVLTDAPRFAGRDSGWGYRRRGVTRRTTTR